MAPFHDLHLGHDESFQLAPGTFFAPIPDWLKNDQDLLKQFSRSDQSELMACTHGFLSEYEVDEIAESGREARAKGGDYRAPKAIKADEVYLASLAAWLRCLPFIGFNYIFHVRKGIVASSTREDRFLYSQDDGQQRPIKTDDLEAIRTLYSALCKIPRHSAPWTATRALTSALQMQRNEIRHLLLWIALEALFGVSDGEIKYRLAQRIAFFLATDRSEAKELFLSAKRGYDTRCKIAHGGWGLKTLGTEENIAVTKTTEEFLRRSFLRLLQDDETRDKFTANEQTRCTYLDNLVFGL